MKAAILSFALSLASVCSAATETWEIRLVLAIPRVADNATSLGFRKYQTQNLRGYFRVSQNDPAEEPSVDFTCLENLTHSVNGRPVTYSVYVDSVIWHGIGSNLTDQFNTRSCSISLIAEPSYAIGVVPTEDNSLVITLSGRGDERCVQGFAAGQIGCGCAEYGHVSPTRIWRTGAVRDTAAVYGRWKAVRKM